jgi:diaminohydroxyphosphoribosylaminopyrimidine deaminase/5-amino-6-(5-phosphoribosylamino)uracil reductase
LLKLMIAPKLQRRSTANDANLIDLHLRLMSSQAYMQRCIQLAKLGAGHVAPNPMVGAVLVHEGRIIGEGWHQQYGQPHAEVNCIASVKEEDRHLISSSTIYVSLEPCSHYGKTPPCADLIVQHNIPVVVIGCHDINKRVDGKGIKKLMMAGADVIIGVLQDECIDLNKRFFTFHGENRPYIILKWAQTANGIMGTQFNDHVPDASERLLISNEYTNRLVHRWRSEEASILVGTNTALYDNPSLTTRLWDGPSPVRLVIDLNLRLPDSLKVFDRKERTIIFNTIKHEEVDNLLYYQVTEDVSIIHQVLHALYHLEIQSVLVEGGAQLLQSFIDEGLWDEIRRIENRDNPNLTNITNGLKAPALPNAIKVDEQKLFSDMIEIFKRPIANE